MMPKGGLSCRNIGIYKITSIRVWEDLTWIIHVVDHNTEMGAKNLFMGILGIG
jgi:hypothetical protein